MTAECTLVVAVCTKKDYNTVAVVDHPLTDQNWVSGGGGGIGRGERATGMEVGPQNDFYTLALNANLESFNMYNYNENLLFVSNQENPQAYITFM